MFSEKEIIEVAKKLNVDFKKIKLEDLITGINIELEHGTINNNTNVTNDDLEMTLKIALAHLNEFPNYYNKDYGLPHFEEMLRQKNNNRNYYQLPSWKNLS